MFHSLHLYELNWFTVISFKYSNSLSFGNTLTGSYVHNHNIVTKLTLTLKTSFLITSFCPTFTRYELNCY